MKKKINIAYLTKDMTVNGITTVIMNYSKNLNKDKYNITIIAGSPVIGTYKEECTSLGIEIIELPQKIKSSKEYYKGIWRNLSKEKYDIVHIHGNSATITIELFIAMIKGIKVRIAHSHNSTCNNLLAHKLLYPIFNRIYTCGFACSELAGRWLFGENNFKVLANGFDTRKFIFNNKRRSKVRKQLGIEGKFVIGTVARFNDQKNHPYLLKVFEAVASEKDNAYLLLVGDGPDLDKIKYMIESHTYKDRIIYYGITNNVEYIYDAIDVFVLPSKHEGLGITFLEAQISGLVCITSDVVPHEVVLGNKIYFLPLEDDVSKWKDIILSAKSINREKFYEEYEDRINQYDINMNAIQLSKYYEEIQKLKRV